MAKLVVKMFISLDGYVAGPKGEFDWTSDFDDDEAHQWEITNCQNAQEHLVGSRSFLDMKAYWPFQTGAEAEAMNEISKIVFSKHGLEAATTTAAIGDADPNRDPAERLPDTDSWDRPKTCTGELKDELERLKERSGKPLLVHGGAGFTRNVLATGSLRRAG